ncbi:MAG TPA: hypothetical protein HPP66_05565 [Planctomycetes bacterium]|nr:hypothetical protein [Planctomycetota bacterium]
MKKYFRITYLFVPIAIFLLGCTGCGPAHQHCVEWGTITESYCQEYTSTGLGCLSWASRDIKICTKWECDSGYERVKGKCVPEDDSYGY